MCFSVTLATAFCLIFYSREAAEEAIMEKAKITPGNEYGYREKRTAGTDESGSIVSSMSTSCPSNSRDIEAIAKVIRSQSIAADAASK
jgi:hypothetical protein